jgi:hypothetical protein
MAYFQNASNVIIHGGSFVPVQGDIHIINTTTDNRDSGMHDFWSVQKSILIDDPMKDLIT